MGGATLVLPPLIGWSISNGSTGSDCNGVNVADVLLNTLPPQLDNVDEQAAQIRRELDGRLQLADRIARVSLAPPTDDGGIVGC